MPLLKINPHQKSARPNKKSKHNTAQKQDMLQKNYSQLLTPKLCMPNNTFLAATN